MDYTWQTCPADILERITSNLNLLESTKAELVCKHWHSNVKGFHRLLDIAILERRQLCGLPVGVYQRVVLQVDGRAVPGDCTSSRHSIWGWLRARNRCFRRLQLRTALQWRRNPLYRATCLKLMYNIAKHLAHALVDSQAPPLVIEQLDIHRVWSDTPALQAMTKAFMRALPEGPGGPFVELGTLVWRGAVWGDEETLCVKKLQGRARKAVLHLSFGKEPPYCSESEGERWKRLVVQQVQALTLANQGLTADQGFDNGIMHLSSVAVDLPSTVEKIVLSALSPTHADGMCTMLLHGPEGLPNLRVVHVDSDTVDNISLPDWPIKELYVHEILTNKETLVAVASFTQLQRLDLDYDVSPLCFSSMTALINLHALRIKDFKVENVSDTDWERFYGVLAALPKMNVLEVPPKYKQQLIDYVGLRRVTVRDRSTRTLHDYRSGNF